MTQKREAKVRRAELLAAALLLARQHGYARITRAMLASSAGVSEGLVSSIFGTMHAFRRDLMRHAVKSSDPTVVMQGLAAKDPAALRAPEALRAAAIATI